MTQEQFDSLPRAVQERWRNEVDGLRPPCPDLIEITNWCLSGAQRPVPPPGFTSFYMQ
jgi:hypothetical protein